MAYDVDAIMLQAAVDLARKLGQENDGLRKIVGELTDRVKEMQESAGAVPLPEQFIVVGSSWYFMDGGAPRGTFGSRDNLKFFLESRYGNGSIPIWSALSKSWIGYYDCSRFGFFPADKFPLDGNG